MIIVLLAIIASSLGVLLAAFLAIATDHKPNASITVCIPILVIGILSCLLMTTQGKPLIEWVLPLSVTLLVSRMRRSLRTVTVVAVIETALAAAGVFFFLQVVVINDDYVVVNETILSRDKNLDNVRLSLLQKRIRSELKPGVIYPPQDIREMLHTVDAKCFAHRVYSREWHSSFTRFSKVRLEHRQIWFLGGTVDGEGREVMLEYRL